MFDDDENSSEILRNIDILRTSNQIDESVMKGHSFRLHTFTKITECYVCGKFLHGSLCQGYNCANGFCGIGIHQGCLPKVKSCLSDGSNYRGLSKKMPKKIQSTARSGSSFTRDVNEKDEKELLEKYPWYHGSISRSEVCDLLKDKQDGYYLVRDSQKECQFVISFMFEFIYFWYQNTVRHIVVQEEGGFHIQNFRQFPTIGELIAYYQTASIKECFENFDTKLLRYPKKVKTMTAKKDAIMFNSKCVHFKAGNEVKIWSDLNPDIWTVEIGNKIGLALAFCFK
ncbi:Guanine nucleotide exchange factor VAV2 [Thelohanellus kitauei]|uniref:Guanine nucleotide exchange factor VAV2 n=1 Tax=Thelohanellus kitauei TaxID=669202 RepID=A0A0C2JA44_THEKT|nr:Guanine nucleotide exchange factor VAV2 [Thelohanellus kitauei]